MDSPKQPGLSIDQQHGLPKTLKSRNSRSETRQMEAQGSLAAGSPAGELCTLSTDPLAPCAVLRSSSSILGVCAKTFEVFLKLPNPRLGQSTLRPAMLEVNRRGLGDYHPLENPGLSTFIMNDSSQKRNQQHESFNWGPFGDRLGLHAHQLSGGCGAITSTQMGAKD